MANEVDHGDHEERFGRLWPLFYGETSRPRDGIGELTALHEEGYLPATSQLAMCFYDGKGVRRDRRRAAEVFHNGAERGDPACQGMLATMFHTGMAGAVEKDEDRARELYRAAASRGNVAAAHNLANMLRAGFGGPPDPIGAWVWHTLSLEPRELPAAWRRGTAIVLAELEEELGPEGLGEARRRLEEIRPRLGESGYVDPHLLWNRLGGAQR